MVSEGGGPAVSSTMAWASGNDARRGAAPPCALPGPARAAARASSGGETEPACPPPRPPGYSRHRVAVVSVRGEGASGDGSVLDAGAAFARRAALSPLVAQTWNSPEALALVRRAVERRLAVQADSSLASYRTRAHGFVFFLAQVGEGLTEPPRLVKADELRRGSVLAGPGPEQAGHPRLARRRLPAHRHQLPPRPPRHRHQQLRQRHPDRRGRRGPRRVSSALAGGARRPTTSRSATRWPSGPRQARPSCQVQVRPALVQPAAGGRARCTSMSPPPSWSGSASASRPPPTSTASWRTSASCWRTRCTRSATGCPTARRSRSGGARPGSTFPARGIIRGRWEIDGLRPQRAAARRAFAGPADRRARSSRDPTDSHLERAARPGDRRGGAAGQPAGHGRARVEVERIAGVPRAGRAAVQAAGRRVGQRLVQVNRVQGLTLGFGGVLGLRGSRVAASPADRLRHVGRSGHRRR